MSVNTVSEASSPPAIAIPAADSGGRIAGLDVLRVVSVVGIVWFHMHAPGYRIAYAGLPAVLVTSVALPTMLDTTRGLGRQCLRRGRRLLVPWLFWSGVYGVALLLRALRHGLDITDLLAINNLFIGTSLHLWYLPFMVLASMAAVVLRRALAPLPSRWSCVLVLSSGWVVLALTARLSVWELAAPLGQWAFGAAAVPLGLAVGIALRSFPARSLRIWLPAIGASTSVVCGVLYALGARELGLPYGVGTPLVCMAALWTPRLSPTALTLVSLSFGIYLLHPLVFEALCRWHAVPADAVALALQVTVISGAMTWLILRTPLRRFV